MFFWANYRTRNTETLNTSGTEEHHRSKGIALEQLKHDRTLEHWQNSKSLEQCQGMPQSWNDGILSKEFENLNTVSKSFLWNRSTQENSKKNIYSNLQILKLKKRTKFVSLFVLLFRFTSSFHVYIKRTNFILVCKILTYWTKKLEAYLFLHFITQRIKWNKKVACSTLIWQVYKPAHTICG